MRSAGAADGCGRVHLSEHIGSDRSNPDYRVCFRDDFGGLSSVRIKMGHLDKPHGTRCRIREHVRGAPVEGRRVRREIW